MTGTLLEPVRICASEELVDGGDGVYHNAVDKGGEATVFFVRYDGKPFGYLNRCAHVPMEMDWSGGKFFESSGLYLMCAAHGATRRYLRAGHGKMRWWSMSRRAFAAGGSGRSRHTRRPCRLLASRRRFPSGLTVLAA